MLAFVDFEASSLRKNGVPIEVGWVREDGREASFLIRPAPGWDDWDPRAEAIHGIPRATLLRDGMPVDTVVAAMVEALGGHDLLASAPSWDGKWLSLLLRAAGRPRHLLRLRDTEDALAAAVRHALGGGHAEAVEDAVARGLAAACVARSMPQHRALADARMEWGAWRAGMDAVTG